MGTTLSPYNNSLDFTSDVVIRNLCILNLGVTHATNLTLGEILFDMQHWTKLNITGAKPTARGYHAACCIAGPLTGQEHPLLLVIGGCGKSKVLRDAWLLDVENEMWSEVSVKCVT